MSDSKDRNNDQLFEDLIDEASSIGSLNIEERNFEDFVPATAAREVVDQKPSRRILVSDQNAKVRSLASDPL